MTVKCKFLQPWRAYSVGAVADLKPELAKELAGGGVVEAIGGPPALASTPVAQDVTYDDDVVSAMEQTISELRQDLATAQSQVADYKARYEALQAQVGTQPAAAEQPAAADVVASSEPPAEPDTPGVAPGTFPELQVSEQTRQKLADAGFQSTQDVIDFGAQNDGLQSVEGIGKVTEAEVVEAINVYLATQDQGETGDAK